MIDYLVERGADVTLTDVHGNDPFKLLLLNFQPEVIISRLLDIIGDYDYAMSSRNEVVPTSPSQVLNKRNNDGFSSLRYIASKEKYGVDIIRKLIELGADPNGGIYCDSDKSAFENALMCRNNLNIPLLTLLIPTNVDLIKVISARVECSFRIMNRVIDKNWTEIESGKFESFVDKLITAGFDITEERLLNHAVRNNNFRIALIKILLQKNIPITVPSAIEAISYMRFDVAILLLNTIYENDQVMVQEIRTNHPMIVCRSLEGTELYRESPGPTILDVIKVLLEKFGIDVNNSDDDNFILHSLVLRRCSDKYTILDYLFAEHPNLDINKKVNSRYRRLLPVEDYDDDEREAYSDDGSETHFYYDCKCCAFEYEPVSALQLALDRSSFDFATKLIHNFASVTDLDLKPPMEDGFTKCYQLLYQLGVEVKFNVENPFDLQKEVDWFKGWIERQKRSIKSLTKLCGLVIRRNITNPNPLDEIRRAHLLPGALIKTLNLTDVQEAYVPSNEP